jgi:hypothetical protein
MDQKSGPFSTGNVNDHVLSHRSGDHVKLLLHAYEWNISKRSLDSGEGLLVSAVWDIGQCNSVNWMGGSKELSISPSFPTTKWLINE